MGLKPVAPKQQATEKALKDHVDTAIAFDTNRIPFQLRSSTVGPTFDGTSTDVGRSRLSKIPCLGLSSRLSFKRVLLTQGLLGILSGAEEVYNWVSYLKHLQSFEFDADRAPESPNSFDFFEKNISLRSEQ